MSGPPNQSRASDALPDLAPRRATLLDVAAEAGVSTAVVSYVLNNGPRKVSEATAQSVRAAMEKLDYRRNRVASALMAGHSNLIGHGHRDIHCLAGPSDLGPFGRRRRGWEQAMAKAGLPVTGRLHHVSPSRIEAAQEIAA